uniref:Uncharacterized protein n=1 Tax=Strigamia maritima TaxID=126957 RepID=T1J1M4_STRMM
MSSTLQPISRSRQLSHSRTSLNSLHSGSVGELSRSPSNISLQSYQSNPSDDEPSLITSPSIQNHAVPTIKVTHPLCRQSVEYTEKIRRKLRFFFMNPIQKWDAKRRFPYKLLVQLFKIIFVTLQGVMFGNTSYSHITFVHGNSLSLSHYFLYNWDATRDVTVYPPAASSYAVYTKTEFYEHINYAVARYALIKQEAIGLYSYAKKDDQISGIEFCKSVFKTGNIYSSNESYNFDNTILYNCLDINPLNRINESLWNDFDVKSYFAANNFTINFHRLVSAEIIIPLKTVLISAKQPPNCYELNITIFYDNSDHNGQLKISLKLKQFLQDCRGDTYFKDSSTKFKGFLYALDLLVISICGVSLLLCVRALIKAQRLRKVTDEFFEKRFEKRLTISDNLEFLNCWYVLIVIDDIIIIMGSIIKLQIENSLSSEYTYIGCSSMLGIGMLLVWFGVLRYLKFFPKYNILILTIQRACPDILRFLLCAGFVYAAFVFNGWLILGPYHLKFKSLSTTSECLFSLINGDDMFASFAITPEMPSWIWWYSRLYFYTFISLFIYIVMSLFIAVIMDAYDTIKNYHQQGFPKSDLMQFVADCTDDVGSCSVRDENTKWKIFVNSVKMCACCKKTDQRIKI